jgi:hypothetical protein
MQSKLTSVWYLTGDRHSLNLTGPARSAGADAGDPDAMLWAASVVTPRQAAPVEETVRAQSKRLLARRDLNLVLLGYAGF